MRRVAMLPAAVALASLDVACVRDEAMHREAVQAVAEPATSKPNAAPVSTAAHSSAPKVLGYPNGTALVIRPSECRLTQIGRGPDDRWEVRLGGCGSVLDATIAPNSMVIARTAAELVAIAADGKRIWSVSAPPVAPELAEPAALLDSVVVAATSPSAMVAYRPDATEAWTFRLDGDERFVAAPRRSETEGAIVISNGAVYAIAPDGTVRWRNTLEPSRN